MDKIYAVILNWNGAKDTINCIQTIESQKQAQLEIIVIDNGSIDNSVQTIQEHYPLIKIFENHRNLGYAGGMNVGIKYAIDQGANYVLLLNNDTLADPDMVSKLLESMDDTGVASPIIFYADHPEKIWSIGGNINPILLELTQPHGNMTISPRFTLERDFLTGCALLIHKDVFLKVGYFDERFFPGYYEDLDFCLRVKRSGFSLKLVPEAKLWHKVSQSSGGDKSNRVYFLMARNSGLYFKKNMRFWNAPFIIIYRLGSALKKSVNLLKNKNLPALSAYWLGLIYGWTGLMKNHEKKYLFFYE